MHGESTFASNIQPSQIYRHLGEQMSVRENATTAGISMGSALAMILSFSVNHSILWAIVHGVCSWFYVIYRAIRGY